ncbi:hypothetical protein MASR2M44_20670 [Bacteroidota bacterium]
MKKLGIIGLSLFVLVSGACKKGGNDSSQNSSIPKYMDIVDAQSLFIGTPTGLKKGSAGTQIFKVMNDSVVIEVISKDERGNDITNAIRPVNICNLSNNYLTVTFDIPFGNNTVSGGIRTFLVRKSDGAVFQGENLIETAVKDGNFAGRQGDLIYEDKSGNIYYPKFNGVQSNGYSIFKLNVSNPNALTIQKYSASGDDVSYFTINRYGDLLYRGGMNQIRYRHPSKGFFNIEKNVMYLLYDANHNNIYGIKGSYNGEDKKSMLIFNRDSLNFVGSPDTSGLDLIRDFCKIKERSKMLYYGNSRNNNQQGDFLFEFSGSNPICSRMVSTWSLGLLGGANGPKLPIIQLIGTNNNYIIYGHDINSRKVLLKVDGANHAVIQRKELDNEIEVQQLVAGSNDEILFYGLRMIDGKKVLATLNASNTITVIKVFEDMDLNTLIRIN